LETYRDHALKPSVYVETSVLSVLVARRSSDPAMSLRQGHTRAGWRRRNVFVLNASPVVRDEAIVGDAREVAKRLAILHVFTPLPLNPNATAYANEILRCGFLPVNAKQDVFHLANAMEQGIDYLLTWNFKHRANPQILLQLTRWAAKNGYTIPQVCPPEALLRYVNAP
jgi:hypothetical protein